MIREDHWAGIEFDWVAVDATGDLAVFSSAGYGPLSGVALERAADQELLIDAIKSASGIPLPIDLLTSQANCLISVFDWKLHDGAYLRVRSPSGEARLSLASLPSHLRSAVTLFGLVFDNRDAISAEEIPFRTEETLPDS